MARLVRQADARDKAGVTPFPTIGRAAGGLLRPALDFSLPPRCPGCGTVVDGDHRFCIDCWRKIDFLGPPACVGCALPLPFVDGPDARCGACLARPRAFDRAYAATAYGDLTRLLALKLKYGTRPAMALTIAKLMVRNVAPGADALLVPVPLHRWRIWRRGYNQAALIASALAKQTGSTAELHALVRTRSTPPLKAMNSAKRRDAVRGAFAVDERMADRIRGRAILLIDDVYTTGSTANACAKALKKAGATSVDLHIWTRVVREAQLER